MITKPIIVGTDICLRLYACTGELSVKLGSARPVVSGIDKSDDGGHVEVRLLPFFDLGVTTPVAIRWDAAAPQPNFSLSFDGSASDVYQREIGYIEFVKTDNAASGINFVVVRVTSTSEHAPWFA